MQYLTSSQLKDLNNYCKNRCQNIILNLNNKKLYYHRGQYKGYTYILKLSSNLLSKNIRMKPQELYNYIKIQKNNLLGKYHKESSYIQGMLDSLYDCLNYISIK